VRSSGRTAARLTALVSHALRPPTPKASPLVSVIIPTFNWSSVLRYAVASVLRQTHEHFEVLVIGDCCTDDSAKVVASFGDARVRWHNLPVNSGSQSLPNNAGLELARGEIVAYLGHDDIWVPSHLARLVTTFERTAVSAAYTVCEAVGPPGSRVRILCGLGSWDPGMWIPPSSFAHRRSVLDEIGGWRDYRTLVEAPDNEFLGRLVRSSGGIVDVPALTVCKFSSAWRRDSYRHRRNAEQAAYFERTAHEARFVARELAGWAWLRVVARNTPLPETQVDPTPDVIPPGWRVGQLRKLRGLPEHPDR
jgi:glycosyltransferase involved in cell wall biosynthesis